MPFYSDPKCTYVESDEGVHYLSLATDASSRKIMGHELSHEMKASDTVKALEQAVKTVRRRYHCFITQIVVHNIVQLYIKMR